MASPAPPSNVTPTVDANDQITLTWDYDPTWFAFDGDDASLGGFNEGRWYSSESVDHFEVEFSRDGIGYKVPAGGPDTVSHDGTTSYSGTYGPASDNPYGTQVGIDSMFKFRVRAVNADGASDWESSGLAFTQAIPPHNPSISRPGANQVTVDMSTKSNIASGIVVEAREDTGSGYGSWDWFDTTREESMPDTYETGIEYSGGWAMKEDARYQFRAYHYVSENRDMDSTETILDYGNQGNVYFEEDFESGDLSSWDSVEQDALVESDGGIDSGFSGADEGTYYLQLDASGRIEKNLGDLSSESDVIVKCAMAAGSLDSSTEYADLEWYDGSSWNSLEDFDWSYNEQGWVEVTALVSSSWLSTDNRIAFDQKGGGGDFTYVDRVVVSDILHEYTKPAQASGLSLDTSVEGEITANWTSNATIPGNVSANSRVFYRKTSESSKTGNGYLSEYAEQDTISGLDDGEDYWTEIDVFIRQYRRGVKENFWHNYGPTETGITILPAPSSPSATAASDTSLDVSWVDEANNENGQEVHYGTIFDDLNDWDVTYGGLVTDRVWEGTNSFYSQNDATAEQARWSPFDSSKQVESFTYYWQETSYSYGGGIRFVNSNGNYEFGVATDNPAWMIDDANGQREPASSGGYNRWVRFTMDFDWANGTFSVDFESYGSDGTTYQESGIPLKQGVDIERLELWNYHDSGGWGEGNLEMWWDSLSFTESVGADVESHTITNLSQDNTYTTSVETYTEHVSSEGPTTSATTYLNELRSSTSHSSLGVSSSVRVVDLLEAISSYGTTGNSNSIRVVDLLEGVTSASTSIRSQTSRLVDLFEGVTSHSTTLASSSIGVIDLGYDVNSHATSGSSASSRLVALVASNTSHSRAVNAYAVRVVDLLEAVTSASSPIHSGVEAVISMLVNVNSHATASASSVETVIDLLAPTLSQSKSAGSDTTRGAIAFEGRISDASFGTSAAGSSLRVVDLIEGVTSSSSISRASSDRGGVGFEGRESDSFSGQMSSSSLRVIDLIEGVTSHSKPSESFVYNNRTSLELIDHFITWNDGEAAWYTDWFQEKKITGSEDQLAIRSLVVEDSKEPAATVIVQYDGNGNGEVDEESDPIRLGRKQTVADITGIPVDEDGFYRLRISQYSGYNSLYAIDTGIVN